MEWIFVAVINTAIATAGFPTEEACLGHKAIFDRNAGQTSMCVKAPGNKVWGSSGSCILSNDSFICSH